MKVKPTKVKGPAGLSTSEVLCGAPVLKVAMIRDDVEWLQKTFQVMMPVLESSDDGKHFLVINFVVSLRFNHGLGAE